MSSNHTSEQHEVIVCGGGLSGMLIPYLSLLFFFVSFFSHAYRNNLKNTEYMYK